MVVGMAVLLVGASFGGGALFSKITSSDKKEETNAADKIEDPDKDKSKEEGKPSSDKFTVQAIDDLLLEGRYQAALDACRLHASDLIRATPALRYRAALSMEALGQYTEAAKLYRSLVTGGARTCSQTAAQLGLARIGFRDKRTTEARDSLRISLARRESGI